MTTIHNAADLGPPSTQLSIYSSQLIQGLLLLPLLPLLSHARSIIAAVQLGGRGVIVIAAALLVLDVSTVMPNREGVPTGLDMRTPSGRT